MVTLPQIFSALPCNRGKNIGSNTGIKIILLNAIGDNPLLKGQIGDVFKIGSARHNVFLVIPCIDNEAT